MDRVLKLPVNENWYNLILDGLITVDYRERTEFWKSRLEDKEYDIVEFYHRFKKSIKPIRYKFIGIEKGRLKNYQNRPVYFIKFGEKIDQ